MTTTPALRIIHDGDVVPPAAAPIRLPRHAFRLGAALVFSTTSAAALTAIVPGVLKGPDVMNGSARGTALVLLVLTVPVLIAAMVRASHRSAAASLVWLGAAAHVLYQSVLFLFGTPFNDLFLLYVAMASLSLASIVVLVSSIDPARFRTHVSPRLPARPVAAFLWFVVGANAALWLKVVVGGIGADDLPAFLRGTGLTTNPIYVQDLVFWLPMAAVAAWWLWQRCDLGFLTAGAFLVMWALESATVAVDQYLGTRADPTSTVASIGGMWIFVILGVATLVPLVAFFRAIDPPA